ERSSVLPCEGEELPQLLRGSGLPQANDALAEGAGLLQDRGEIGAREGLPAPLLERLEDPEQVPRLTLRRGILQVAAELLQRDALESTLLRLLDVVCDGPLGLLHEL